MERAEGVMLVIKRGGKFLLGRRAEWKAKAPSYWCPISGLIEHSESQEDAVVREAAEEIGSVVRPVRRVASTRTHDGAVTLHWWVVELVSGEPRLNNNENSELGWFGPDELRQLKPAFSEDIELMLGLSTNGEL
jgi:8-oxo-dGTP diphosphatase